MKFDFAIGNPPYQETKGGTKNVDVWPYFIKGANEVADTICYIHPGRWIIPKKQMKAIHDYIVKSGLICFDYYSDSRKIFRGLGIDGGVTVTLFKKKFCGKIRYLNNGIEKGYYEDGKKFFANQFEEEAYSKIHLSTFGSRTMSDYIVGNIGSLNGSEYGYNKTKHLRYLRDSFIGMNNPVKIWANNGFGKGSRFSWHYIERDILDSVPDVLLKTRKVMIDKKGHAITMGKGNILNNIPKIVDKDVIASGDVLFVLPANDTKEDLELIQSLFMTCTGRFLMSITQKDLCVRGFENIPDYQYFKPMLKGKLFTDDFFFRNFGFSDELIRHIESSISLKMGVLVGQIHSNEKRN